MSKSDMHGAKRFIRPVTYGIMFGVAACFLLLMAMSVLMSVRDIPQSAVSVIATLVFVLGGFVSGFVCSACSREKGLILGLCCGCCLFLILSLASIAVNGAEFGPVAMTKFAAVLCAAALGGIFGVNKRKKFK